MIRTFRSTLKVRVPISRCMATIDITVREAINGAIDEEMARDSKVFVIGTI
jgi:hypothetical protein